MRRFDSDPRLQFLPAQTLHETTLQSIRRIQNQTVHQSLHQLICLMMHLAPGCLFRAYGEGISGGPACTGAEPRVTFVFGNPSGFVSTFRMELR